MKTKFRFLASTTLLTLACSPLLLAQDSTTPQPSPSPSVAPANPGGAGGGPERRRGAMFGNMSQEDREKLKAAREKAMQDPKVQDAQENAKAANEAFQNARRQALLAADPSVGPILDKVQAALKSGTGTAAGQGKGNGGFEGRGGWRMAQALDTLTPEEREKLKAAEQKIKDNPDLVSARDKKVAADQLLASTLHDAMIAADPTIEPLLKKMEGFRKHHEGGAGGPPPQS